MSTLALEWIQVVKQNQHTRLQEAPSSKTLQALDVRGQNLLFYAIKSQAQETLLSLIEQYGLDVNQKNRFSESPLHIAAHMGNDTAVEILLNHGSDVRVLNDKCQSPLMLAAAKGAKDTVKTLIAHGARVHGHDDLGQSVLFYALRGRKKSIFRQLVEAGASVHEVNIKRQTLMHELALIGDLRLFNLLQEAGVNLFISDIYRQTPLHVALQHKHTDLAIQFSLSGLSSYSVDHFNETPYTLAEKYGNEEILAFFERQKNDPKHKQTKQLYPLHDALLKGHTDYVLAHLKTHQASLLDASGASLLFYALMLENLSVFEALLASKIPLEPFHETLPYGLAEAVILMRQDDFVHTLMHYHPEVFEQLNPSFLSCALNTTKALLKR